MLVRLCGRHVIKKQVQRYFAKRTLIEDDTPIIPLEESRRFMRECMEAVGTPPPHAEALAIVLAEADYRGHYSHGMNRIEYYVDDVLAGTCDATATPQLLKQSPATAWVDACNGLGVVAGNFCMKLAMDKALAVGVGWVTCKGSNHFGIAGAYAMQAQRAGLVGMAFTNTSPFLVPTRARQAGLGTNPISFAAPAKATHQGFVLDMATTAVAVGKLEIQRRKGGFLPKGWAMDSMGNVTSDPEDAMTATRLLPLGGEEQTSGFKGYGLAMMVEILCAICSGATFGKNVRQWSNHCEVANLGHCFIAMNPECFAPLFLDRMEELTAMMKGLDRVNEEEEILISGDPEREHMQAVDCYGGVKYLQQQLDSCDALAKQLNIAPLKGLVSR